MEIENYICICSNNEILGTVQHDGDQEIGNLEVLDKIMIKVTIPYAEK